MNITLTANPSVASVGQEVSIGVVVNAGPNRPVGAVQVYLEYDVTVLESISLQGGGGLSEQLLSRTDTTLGRVDYAAGTLGAPLDSPFTLATVTFRVLSATGPGGTAIEFAPLVPPRHTKVAVGAGIDTTGDLIGVTVVVR